MSLGPEQVRKLYLSGTVQFPVAFPKLGEISINLNGVEFINEPPNLDTYKATLKIEEIINLSPRKVIVRIVLLDNVAAVFIPDKVDSVDYAAGTWLIGLQIQDTSVALNNLNAAIDRSSDNSGEGIVFLSENAGVLNEFEAIDYGATAGESADATPRTCCP